MKILRYQIPAMTALFFCLLLYTGCGAQNSGNKTEISVPETDLEISVPGPDARETETVSIDDGQNSRTVVRVGAMKGPTTMGLVKLMEENEEGSCEGAYAFTMVTAADELTALVAGGKVDIALVPANVAAILYQKTEHSISVIDINTLNVLYLISANDGISSIKDLKGRSVCLPGKGTTPEYALRYLIQASGLSEEDVTLEFQSEAAQVAAILAENPDAVGLLPQPFAASALLQNDALSPVLDLGQIWTQHQDGENTGQLVTGVAIVRNDFLASHREQVDIFLREHEASISFVRENPAQSAALIEKAGIVAKAAVAQKALPDCNISFLSGPALKEALGGYLTVLYGERKVLLPMKHRRRNRQ